MNNVNVCVKVVCEWDYRPIREGRQSSYPFPAREEVGKESATCHLEEGSHQNPATLTPASLQDYEKHISGFYKPPRLWYFVIAAQTD